jgi:hypothetical protein
MSAHTTASTPERLWWARTLLVLGRPSPVFVAIRDDSAEDAGARQEPVLAIVIVAGIAVVLSSSFAGGLLDDRELDALDLAVWAFLGGALEGFAAYFLLGGLVYLGATFAGSVWTYRQARHVLAFAAVPLALSLPVWAATLGVAESDSVEVVRAIVLGWAALLLVVGLRAVHAWSWGRALAAAALPLAVPALAVARGYGLV